MNRLNRKIEYALIALKYMSGRYAGQLTTVKEICNATHAPFDATSRVMQQMAQKNILKAEQGAHGGYMLIRDLSKISFLEIVELISGNVEVVRCISGESSCELSSNCNMASPLKVFNERLSQFFASLSVAELIHSRESSKELKAEAT
jgi:Rrf2 family nitric oxide-sensitive transcriptional repressor